MKRQLTVAAVQLTSTTNVESNLERAASLVRQAATQGADLIALPENHGFLGSEAHKMAHAQSVEEGEFLAPFRRLARDLGVAILAGSIPEVGPDKDHVYNTSVLLGRDGETIATYRKIHLFDVNLEHAKFQESSHVTAGTHSVVAELDGWRIGMTVCYDLRFPELYRELGSKGAQILTVPAAFTLHTGKDHWEVLLRARAIENQAFVVAPGQFGHDGDRRHSWGKSLVVDPWGTCLATAPEREGIALAVLSAGDIEQIRKELPALEHRKM